MAKTKASKVYKEEDEETSEEKIWRQIVPSDSVDLSDGRIVTQPFVRKIQYPNNASAVD